MRQAITTRFAGPTDSNGSRVIVRSARGRMVVPWNHALDVGHNHVAAARAMILRYGWTGTWSGGGTPDGTGYVFVVSDDDTFVIGGAT